MATQIRIAKQTNACAYTQAANAKVMVRVAVVVDVAPPSHTRWPLSLSASCEGRERLLFGLRG